jgi:NADPH:quinone reductase-like Zn-dependent oxidoreductase
MSTAVVCTALTGEDGLEIREQPDRPLRDGEVRIAVRAASVNYPDVLIIRGYLMVGFVAGIPVVKLNQTVLKNISLIGVAYGASAIAVDGGMTAQA